MKSLIETLNLMGGLALSVLLFPIFGVAKSDWEFLFPFVAFCFAMASERVRFVLSAFGWGFLIFVYLPHLSRWWDFIFRF